jgi:internalin A
MEELQKILSQEESEEAWNQLIDYLDTWTDSDLWSTAIDYAQKQLKNWSDEQRKVPRKHWKAIQSNAHIPAWWPIVRHLDIEEDDNLLQPFIRQILDNITSIELINCNLAAAELSLLAELNKLGCLNWFDLIDSLDEWPEDEPIEEILASAEAQIKDWTDKSRKASRSDWISIRKGNLIPRWWKLVRYLKLEEDDHEIKPLEAFTYLTILDASNATFVSIEDLAQLTNLLHLSFVEDLVSFGIEPISVLTNLTYLRLAIIELEDLYGLRNLQNLEFLDLSYNTDLIEIEDVAFLEKLDYLILDNCTQLTDITPLSELTQIRKLSLKDCTSLTDLSPLAGLYQLEYLNLEGCESLTDISSLSSLTNCDITR